MSKQKKQREESTKRKVQRQISAAVREMFPDCIAEFTGNQGHRTPRVRLLGFRVRDNFGKYRSNIVWVDPTYEGEINEAWVRWAVAESNK